MEVYTIPQGITDLGRDELMDVRISEPCISSTHARIYNVKEGFWVEDLGSTNGTYFRGAMVVEPTMISAGDVVQFGTSSFTYEVRDEYLPEVTSHVENMGAVVENVTGVSEENEVPEHTVPSDSAVKIYRRKTSRIDYDNFKRVIEEGMDYSDSKPLPSKYEVTDSGRISPTKFNNKREPDIKINTDLCVKSPFPWESVLVASVLVSLGLGTGLGYALAKFL